MSRPVTFTLDLEDLRTSPAQELRVEIVTHRLLDVLAAKGVVGTVFVVGELAQRHPDLVRRVAEEGHEVGIHAWRHGPLVETTPDRFREDTRRARGVVEDVTGAAATGYRAPMWSLVPETQWITEELAEHGFTYSSSLLPAPSPLYGWPGAPRTPFRWPSGLVELPAPMLVSRYLQIPFLGGTYLRLLPAALRRRALDRVDPDAVLWAYCHPWEFDPDERFYQFEHGGYVASRIGWLNRKGMQKRVEAVLEPVAGPPLGEVVAGLGELPVFPTEAVGAGAAGVGADRADQASGGADPQGADRPRHRGAA